MTNKDQRERQRGLKSKMKVWAGLCACPVKPGAKARRGAGLGGWPEHPSLILLGVGLRMMGLSYRSH